MTSPEDPRASPASGKPSLVGQPLGAISGRSDDAAPMRMLDGIGGPRGSSSRRASKPRLTWPWVAGLGLLVLALALWWSRSALDVDSAEPSARAGASTTAAVTPSDAPPANAAAPSVAGSPSGSAPTLAAHPARIETSAEPAPRSPRIPPAALAVQAHAAPAASTAARTSVAMASRAARPAAAPPPPPKQAAPRPGDDPDVALVRAMLARLSTGTGANTPALNATIGQLAARCEANGHDDPIAALECRRQICADHWGRVDACPMAMAPKAP